MPPLRRTRFSASVHRHSNSTKAFPYSALSPPTHQTLSFDLALSDSPQTVLAFHDLSSVKTSPECRRGFSKICNARRATNAYVGKTSLFFWFSDTNRSKHTQLCLRWLSCRVHRLCNVLTVDTFKRSFSLCNIKPRISISMYKLLFM